MAFQIDTFIAALEQRLRARERDSKTVSMLGTGAAFEAWLSFEARLMLMERPGNFGIGGYYRTADGAQYNQYAALNEWRKVDLSIINNEEFDADPPACECLIEFKMVYNNKNWRTQVASCRSDLYPTSKRKAALNPARGRFAVAVVVGKVYREPERYTQWPDLALWSRELESDLLRTTGPRRIHRRRRGTAIPISSSLLTDDSTHFVRLDLLEPA